MQKELHPGASWMFRLGSYWTFVFLGIFLFVFSFNAFFLKNCFSTLCTSLSNFWVFIIIYIAFALIFTEFYARLAYNNWKYEFTETNLKIEKGIIWKRYSNIPYERIQNVDIQRGVFARILGFSTVNIQTAGFSAPTSGSGRMYSEGYIPAVSVDEAENIREFIMGKISGKGKKKNKLGL